MPPQPSQDKVNEVTSFMKPAPTPNDNEMGTPEDDAVADPLSAKTIDLLNDTARRNREIFTELFRPVPTNLVRNWAAYDVTAFLFFIARYGNLINAIHLSLLRTTCQRSNMVTSPRMCPSNASRIDCHLSREVSSKPP